ncbi:RimK/LysX family protein [Halobacteriovorax sp. HLS]|uniref:ATP-dependent zinc protease family protein n=1 Tax=Halobacteriovorax sp. HLS TaxID=2234000 RepID=UPI001F4E94E5|nr:RimK/LysX family protein [Halobacteriovorax sp. HLS]
MKKIIGWREWVELPEIGVKSVKAKVDSGARTSSLHVFDMTFYHRAGKEYAKFSVHPYQKDDKTSIVCREEVIEYRKIRSSNGQVEKRPVILTNVKLLDETWPVEITLTNRDEMGFRMLLGRTAFRKKFLVDCDKSFYSKKRVK